MLEQRVQCRPPAHSCAMIPMTRVSHVGYRLCVLRWGVVGTVAVAALAFLGLKCGRFLLDSAKAAEQPKRRDEK